MKPIIFSIFFLTFPLWIWSQTADSVQDNRPRLGLALSGGGAKGMAHVGVLKVLEQAGIRPDYISGTSMGSIIGGLYAIGYSADTLEHLIRTQDWDQVLSDLIPLNEVIFEEKVFFENELLEFAIIDGKFRAPSGLIYGQQISKLLSELTLPAYQYDNFKEFPTPFVAIGADIANGKYQVLDEGYLADAMRISMAIPTVFTPVRQDTFLYVDGGLIHNFPVREVKELGSDLIIGVYTGRKLADREQLGSFSSILAQSIFLLGIQDAERQKHLCNIYIEPDLTNYTALDFGKSDSIMLQGERAALQLFEPIRELGDFLKENGVQSPRPSMLSLDKIQIDSIEVNGNKLITKDEIKNKFELLPGSQYSIARINQGINELYGTNFFEKVTYSFRYDNGKNVLTLNCEERPAITMKVALNYDSYLKAGFLFNITVRNLIARRSRLIFSAKIAENFRTSLTYLQYLDKTNRFAWNTGIFLNREEIPFFVDGRRNVEYDVTDFLIDTRLQRRFGHNSMLSGGFQFEQLNLVSRIGRIEDFFNSLNYTNVNAVAAWQLNTIDRNILPTQGVTLELKTRVINNIRNEATFDSEAIDSSVLSSAEFFNQDPFFSFLFQSKSYIPTGENESFVFGTFAGFLLENNNSFGEVFLVGSPQILTRRSIPFYGFNANEILAQSALGGTAGYQYFLRDDIMLSIDGSIGVFRSPNSPNPLLSTPDLILAGAGATVSYDSFLGPIQLSFMYPIETAGSIPGGLRTFLTIGHRF